MPHTKTTHSKSSKKVSAQSRTKAKNDIDEATPVVALNDKKPFDIEDDAVAVPVDKLEETDSPEPSGEEEDAAEEEAGLDEEELNPFGDKWEV